MADRVGGGDNRRSYASQSLESFGVVDLLGEGVGKVVNMIELRQLEGPGKPHEGAGICLSSRGKVG